MLLQKSKKVTLLMLIALGALVMSGQAVMAGASPDTPNATNLWFDNQTQYEILVTNIAQKSTHMKGMNRRADPGDEFAPVHAGRTPVHASWRDWALGYEDQNDVTLSFGKKGSGGYPDKAIIRLEGRNNKVELKFNEVTFEVIIEARPFEMRTGMSTLKLFNYTITVKEKKQ